MTTITTIRIFQESLRSLRAEYGAADVTPTITVDLMVDAQGASWTVRVIVADEYEGVGYANDLDRACLRADADYVAKNRAAWVAAA